MNDTVHKLRLALDAALDAMHAANKRYDGAIRERDAAVNAVGVVRASRDDALSALSAMTDERDDAIKRAEAAERERDELRVWVAPSSDVHLLYSPASGQRYIEPSGISASAYRFGYPSHAWLYNPWTGEPRGSCDVGSDPFRLAMVPPGPTKGGRS